MSDGQNHFPQQAHNQAIPRHTPEIMLLEATRKIRALEAELTALRAENAEMREALKNLFAMVQGECPSLLEDSHHYDMITAALNR